MMPPPIPSLLRGDNLEILKGFPAEFIDLAYLDPPFFTRKDQTLFDRTLSDVKGAQLSFRDVWTNHEEYLEWIGIDSSEEAIEISKRRLASKWNPFDQTKHHTPYRISRFLKLSRTAKIQHIAMLLNMNIVQRNANLDGFLKDTFDGYNVAVRYVESDEPVDSISRFAQVAHKKQSKVGIVIIPRATEKEKEHLQKLFQNPVKIFVFSYRDICRKIFNVEDIVFSNVIRHAALH